MPIGAILGGALAGVGSIFGAGTSASASKDAATIQAQAAERAAQLQYQAAQDALGFQKQIYGDTTGNLAPYLGGGTNALAALLQGLGITPGGGLDLNASLLANPQNQFGAPPTLNLPALGQLPTYAPSGFQQSPGYQWQRDQGIQGVQNAATGPSGSLSGNMLKAADTYTTGLANQDYYNWLQQIYNPTYQSKLTNVLLPYETNNQNTLAKYNADSTNYWQNVGQAGNVQQNALKALTGLSGAGQNAAVQQGGFGQNYGAAGSNLITGGGNALAGGIVGAGNAAAAGRIGGANALTGGVNAFTNSLLAPSSTYSNSNISNLLNMLLGGGGGGSYAGLSPNELGGLGVPGY